ncbi:uncharacterized protein LOC114277813 [Camellia sinensis]|uniref:uncharacterized protein LOC114277813 n=1 Tax=Camellia sinensis TaxID=4442 RepID=UPI001035CACD|nr:uncharacterized protein LOC114277813 [Camellia sinensis]
MLLGSGWILSLVIIKWFQLGCTTGVPALIMIFIHQVTLNTLLYIHCMMILGEISRVFFPECSVSSISKFYTYMDGVYYWSACNKNHDATKLSFHMGYEVFQNILEQDEPVPFKGIPELGCPHPGTNLVGHYFGVYNGSLAWIQSYPTHYVAPNVFNIWVLKERWTREFLAGPFEGAIPLSFWNKGEFLIQVEDGHLYLVDPITREMKDLRTVASQAIVYHESLVSVQRRDEEFDHSYVALRLKFDIFY